MFGFGKEKAPKLPSQEAMEKHAEEIGATGPKKFDIDESSTTEEALNDPHNFKSNREAAIAPDTEPAGGQEGELQMEAVEWDGKPVLSDEKEEAGDSMEAVAEIDSEKPEQPEEVSYDGGIDFEATNHKEVIEEKKVTEPSSEAYNDDSLSLADRKKINREETRDAA